MNGHHRFHQFARLIFVWAIALFGMVTGCSAGHATSPRRVGISEKLDVGSAVVDADKKLAWYDARNLTIEGKGFTDTVSFYQRLPARAQKKICKLLWTRSTSSAGMAVRFVTNSRNVWVRWTLVNEKVELAQMPSTGINGVDLYVYLDGRYQWIGAGRPTGKLTAEKRLVGGMAEGLHEYMLYLPLYNEAASVEIGVACDAVIGKPLPRPAERARPICFYGTSIIHGACASRPGMTMVAMVGRRLDRPVINLGFGGAGEMEMEIAELLAELDVAVYVLDCLPNMTIKMMQDRLKPFVMYLREAKPDTPIVLVESVFFPARDMIEGAGAKHARKNALLKTFYADLKARGVTKLHYVPGDNLLGNDGEGTVEGVHPSDLGFYRFADAMEPVLRKIVE